jgi:hypothetical protein
MFDVLPQADAAAAAPRNIKRDARITNAESSQRACSRQKCMQKKSFCIPVVQISDIFVELNAIYYPLY